MIWIPRALLVTLAALFSAYHLFLAGFSLPIPAQPMPVIVAMVLYAVATLLSLWPAGAALPARPGRSRTATRMPARMPIWLAAFNLAVCAALPVLVASQLDSVVNNGYATWYVAAVGTLMTITATRRQVPIAWIGVGFLVVHTVLWSGSVMALASFGVIGSVAWVGIAQVLVYALVKAGRDADRFAQAEREATQWRVAQEAHISEGQVRLRQTAQLASPVLTRVIDSGGELSEGEREECRLVEGAIRDEIRGRQLLNDEIRREVMAARRRGVIVTMLDEGGIDDLEPAYQRVVLSRLASAIRGSRAGQLIVRTVPDDSRVAVTVVGLIGETPPDVVPDEASEADVELWLEIPRQDSPLQDSPRQDSPRQDSEN
ncbi:MAG: hypothetical protein ABI255_04755 [Microbacteriaceae bacterium]